MEAAPEARKKKSYGRLCGYSRLASHPHCIAVGIFIKDEVRQSQPFHTLLRAGSERCGRQMRKRLGLTRGIQSTVLKHEKDLQDVQWCLDRQHREYLDVFMT
jgi:hypothetical protein